MLEIIERILAAMIILALLVVIMFIFFPQAQRNVAEGPNAPTTEQVETPPEQAAPSREEAVPLPKDTAAKEDAKPFVKVVDRIGPTDNQNPIYEYTRRKPPQQTVKRFSSKDRHRNVSTPYVKTAGYRYRASSVYRDPYDCEGEDCYCGCDGPYWARSSASCWDW